MTFNPDIHHRRSIRLKHYDYSQAGTYFVTICTHNKECLFGDVRNGEMLLNECGQFAWKGWEWLANQYEYTDIDEFVIMPNHLHGILIINDCAGGSLTARTSKPLGSLIGAYKTVSSKQINLIRNTPGISVWQRNYYEHIIRSEQEMNKIREYIINNPLNWESDENYEN